MARLRHRPPGALTWLRRSRAGWLAGAALVFIAARAEGRAPLVDRRIDGVAVSPGFTGAVRADEPIELRIDPSMPQAGGRLAVLIDRTDWSALFAVTPTRAVYQPTTVRVPPGEHVMRIFLVSAREWTPVGQFALRIDAAPAAAVSRSTVSPAFELANKGQVAEGHSPATTPPARSSFQDFTATGGLQMRSARAGWANDAQIHVLGVSHRGDALRFNLEPEAAPLVDLVDYALKTERAGFGLSIGHVRLGANRQLFNDTATRGVLATARFGSRADLALSVVHGTPIVGWDDLLGVERPDHRVVGGTLGVELIPKRPGGLRVETSLLSGRQLPQDSINRASINDSEESRGAGLRVVASDRARRFQLDGGYSRSTFTNPADPLLSQGTAIVAVAPETRDARYLDVSYAALQGRKFWSIPTTLVASVRHERIDPLFGSIVANPRSDVLQNAVSVDGQIGPATFHAAGGRMRDNLDDVESILTTFTHTGQLTVAVPIGQFAAKGTIHGAGWPNVTYVRSHVHQFGGAIPANGGFVTAAQVPNQATTDQALGLDWHFGHGGAGYRISHTYQDNRQAGRELTDVGHLMHTLSVQLSSRPADLQIELALERAHNQELATDDVTHRWGFIGNWRPTRTLTITAIASTLALNKEANPSHALDTDVSLQISQGVPLPAHGPTTRQLQLFARVARHTGERVDRAAALELAQHSWALHTGLTVRVF